MPEQSYNIGYGLNDFFYDKGNLQLLKTLPFHKGNLIAWVKSKTQNSLSESNDSTMDFFDVKITKYIFLAENKDSFINDYLPGNIEIKNMDSTFSKYNFSNFNTRATDVSFDSNVENLYSLANGSITINTTGQNSKPIIYDFSLNDIEKSSIRYKTDGTIDISSLILNSNNTEKTVQDPGAGTDGTSGGKTTSLITNNTSNPRCKYRKNCEINHWHYQKCDTKTFYNPDGTSYCRCVCKGPREKNNNPHSHCSPYNVNNYNYNDNDNKNKNYNNDNDNTLGLTNAISTLITDIKVSVKPKKEISTSSQPNFNFIYNNYNNLINNDLLIRTKLYDYYFELNRNKELRDSIITNNSIDATSKQALLDANVKYKKEYLQLFNIFSGIFFISGYIYVMNK